MNFLSRLCVVVIGCFCWRWHFAAVVLFSCRPFFRFFCASLYVIADVVVEKVVCSWCGVLLSILLRCVWKSVLHSNSGCSFVVGVLIEW